MKKFLVLYSAPAAVMAKMATTSQEEKEKGMQAWFQWKNKYDNHILDFGSPLMPGLSSFTSGAWTPSDSDATGYSVIQAESIDEAKSLFVDHPHLAWAEGCGLVVHEFAPM